MEDFLYELAQLLGLSAYEYEMLIHDVNNLRGDEWLDMIKELGDEGILEDFKEIAGIEDDDEDDDEDGSNKQTKK